MTTMSKKTSFRQILLVYYSPDAQQRLEATLLAQHFEVYSIDGRAPDAIAAVREHPAGVVVIDRSAKDVSVTQAVRQIGQILMGCLVVTMYPGHPMVDIYQSGRRISVKVDLETALRDHPLPSAENHNARE